MDWSKGYSARYYASIVDKKTMRDLGTSKLNISQSQNPNRIEIVSGSIKRTYSDLRESADLTCTHYDFKSEQIIRIWLDARQNGETSHIPLFTGLAASPKRTYKGRLVKHTVECYSMLKIADDILLQRGWYAPIGLDGPTLVADLLSCTGVTIHINPIESEARELKSTILAESGDTNLTMADAILSSIEWGLHLDGYGDIYLDPIPRDASSIKASYGSLENDVIELNFDKEYDWYSAPNVIQAVLDDMVAVARDDDPESSFSTVNRGREIWYEENDCYLNDSETLAEYAYRRLKELQQISTTVNYDRRYDPNLYPIDLVSINYPLQDLVGTFRVYSQSIDLGYGCRTSEEVVQI